MRIFTVSTVALAAIAVGHAASPVFMIDATPTDPRALASSGSTSPTPISLGCTTSGPIRLWPLRSERRSVSMITEASIWSGPR